MKTMNRALLNVVLLLVGLAGAIAARSYAADPTLAYRSWKLVTPKPLDMDPTLAALCAPPTALRGQLNGHSARMYRVYVNAIGAKAMDKGGTFPVGSTIVKEKLIPKGKSFDLELATVMTKHRKGFNQAGGDWDFYVENPAGSRITAPKEIADCASCHHDPRAKDMVFRTYVRTKR